MLLLTKLTKLTEHNLLPLVGLAARLALGLLLILGVAPRIGLAAAGFYLYWRPNSRFALDNRGK